MQKKIGRGRGARTKEILESKQCGTSKSVICISMYFVFIEGIENYSVCNTIVFERQEKYYIAFLKCGGGGAILFFGF